MQTVTSNFLLLRFFPLSLELMLFEIPVVIGACNWGFVYFFRIGKSVNSIKHVLWGSCYKKYFTRLKTLHIRKVLVYDMRRFFSRKTVAVADSGEVFEPNWGPKGRKNIFVRPAFPPPPSTLSQGLDNRGAPYLKLWIRYSVGQRE